MAAQSRVGVCLWCSHFLRDVALFEDAKRKWIHSRHQAAQDRWLRRNRVKTCGHHCLLQRATTYVERERSEKKEREKRRGMVPSLIHSRGCKRNVRSRSLSFFCPVCLALLPGTRSLDLPCACLRGRLRLLACKPQHCLPSLLFFSSLLSAKCSVTKVATAQQKQQLSFALRVVHKKSSSC